MANLLVIDSSVECQKLILFIKTEFISKSVDTEASICSNSFVGYLSSQVWL